MPQEAGNENTGETAVSQDAEQAGQAVAAPYRGMTKGSFWSSLKCMWLPAALFLAYFVAVVELPVMSLDFTPLELPVQGSVTLLGIGDVDTDADDPSGEGLKAFVDGNAGMFGFTFWLALTVPLVLLAGPWLVPTPSSGEDPGPHALIAMVSLATVALSTLMFAWWTLDWIWQAVTFALENHEWTNVLLFEHDIVVFRAYLHWVLVLAGLQFLGWWTLLRSAYVQVTFAEDEEGAEVEATEEERN